MDILRIMNKKNYTQSSSDQVNRVLFDYTKKGADLNIPVFCRRANSFNKLADAEAYRCGP